MRTVLLFLLFAVSSLAYAQQPEWLVYNTLNSGLPDNQVQAIATDSSSVWIGTANGLARYDAVSWQVYDTAGTPLPSSFITALSTDGVNGVWVGTNKGLAWFDGAAWLVFDTSNSPLPNNMVTAIVRTASGILWVGTEGGLATWDGSAWTIYNDSSSGLIDNLVRSVGVDSRGTVWVGTFDTFKFVGRLSRFDGTSWTRTRLDLMGLPSSFPDALIVDTDTSAWLGTNGTTGGALVRITGSEWNVLDRSNSGLPRGGVSSLAREGSTMWIATSEGLVSFDGTSWETFARSSSGLPDDFLLAVDVDGKGNKWIGTLSGGIAVYRKGGIVSSVHGSGIEEPIEFALFQNYPNPFNPTTGIRFQVSGVSHVKLTVYDILGRQVAMLVNERKRAGIYQVEFDGSNLASGVYFYQLHTRSLDPAGGWTETFIETKKLVLAR